VRRDHVIVSLAGGWLAAGMILAATTLSAGASAATDPVAQGRALFQQSCSSCHGLSAQGVADSGPSLVGVGAASADFELSTGRMPLADPRDEPERSTPRLSSAEIRELVAYVGSLGGPAIPDVDATQGNLAAGFRAFTLDCAGCHQSLARGGTVIGGVAPSLVDATPTQIAEAVRVGPYEMPPFSPHAIDSATLDSIVRYVQYAKHPVNAGGFGLGNLGPIPEGLVAWLVAGAGLLLVARLVGERTPG
jgi:ubiquinol-cytochrome c reductase cytochrome c subunit